MDIHFTRAFIVLGYLDFKYRTCLLFIKLIYPVSFHDTCCSYKEVFMTFHDLSYFYEENMPLYPGTEKPYIHHFGPEHEDGFRVTWMNLQSHMGTHMDAPYHYFRDRKKLDEFPVSTFVGKAFVMDIPLGFLEIDKRFLEHFKTDLEFAEILVLRTHHARFYGTDAYFDDYPILTEEAARYLTTFKLRGIGLDAISVDAVETSNYPIHEILLEKNWFIVENLTGLEAIQKPFVQFIALPLKIKDADGAPVRVVAIE